MTPGFRAWATGWMTVPFAEMGSQDEAQVWGEDTELGSWLVKVGQSDGGSCVALSRGQQCEQQCKYEGLVRGPGLLIANTPEGTNSARIWAS